MQSYHTSKRKKIKRYHRESQPLLSTYFLGVVIKLFPGSILLNPRATLGSIPVTLQVLQTGKPRRREKKSLAQAGLIPGPVFAHRPPPGPFPELPDLF